MFHTSTHTMPQYFQLPIFIPPVVTSIPQTFSPFNLPKVRESPPVKRTLDLVTEI